MSEIISLHPSILETDTQSDVLSYIWVLDHQRAALQPQPIFSTSHGIRYRVLFVWRNIFFQQNRRKFTPSPSTSIFFELFEKKMGKVVDFMLEADGGHFHFVFYWD